MEGVLVKEEGRNNFFILCIFCCDVFYTLLSHFKIAGGLVLLVLSIRELVIYGEDKGKMGGLGVVPHPERGDK
jgi:small neutral amino acid transporter SnatA (MarC family)